MASAEMTDMMWKMRRIVRRLRPEGLAGLMLLVVALVILLAGVLPLRDEVDGLRTQLAARPSGPQVITPVLPPEQVLAKELATFQDKFPTVDKLADELDALFRLAEGHELAVDKGEYTLVEKVQGPLRRFEATLPVIGTYPQVRALILDVLEKLPTASLADVAFEREQVGDDSAKTTLRFVFFVRKRM